jgi:elongator complex protein 3
MQDIRHRELKNKKNKPEWAELHNYTYNASDGKEIFLTFEDPEDRTIFSLLRLRFPSILESDTTQTIKSHKDNIASPMVKSNIGTSYQENLQQIHSLMPELIWASIVREIHTFGDQLSIGEKWWEFGQHVGFWKKLITESEKLSKQAGYSKIAVIAGVWVRKYYEKRGYTLTWEYMVKDL